MATRVNTKFVLILCSIMIVLVMGVAAIWYKFVHKDPKRQIMRADSLLAQGKTDDALDIYEAVLTKDSNNLELTHTIINVLNAMKPTDRVEAFDILRKSLGYLRHATELLPHDEALLENYFGKLHELGETLGQGYYESLLEQSSNKVENYPDNIVGNKYHGIAQVSLLRPDLTPEEIQQARASLETAREIMPDDAETAFFLARWYISQASRFEHDIGKDLEVERLKNQAIDIAAKTYNIDPNDPLRIKRYLTILLYRKINMIDEATAIIDRLESELLDNPEPEDLVNSIAYNLTRVDTTPIEQPDDLPETTRGLVRAEKILRTAAEKHPDVISHTFQLASMLNRMHRVDDALAHFQKVREYEQYDNYLDYLKMQNMKMSSNYEISNLLIIQAEKASDSETRENLILQARSLIDEMITNYGETPHSNLQNGKILLVEGKYQEALTYFVRASSGFNDSNLDALRICAETALLAREYGEAAQKMELFVDGLSSEKDSIPFRKRLVELYLGMKQIEPAQEHLEIMASQNPDDDSIRILRADMLAVEGEYEEALTIYRGMKDADNGRIAQKIAGVYSELNQKDKARVVLKDYCRDHPEDVTALRQLLFLTDDPDEKQSIIDMAAAGGISEKQIKILRISASLGDTDDTDAIADQLLDIQEDPLQKAVTQARYYYRLGNKEKSRTALEEAAAIDPDDPFVIAMRFEFALDEKDWAAAEQLAHTAKEKNLDFANGRFYEGQLLKARGELDNAINALQEALSVRPVFADGHRMLAMAMIEKGDYEAAEASYRKAITQRPNSFEALTGLAYVLNHRGQYQEALDLFRKAKTYQPGNPVILEQYLNYEVEHGNRDTVLEERWKIAEEKPDNSVNKRKLALLLAEDDSVDDALDIIQELIDTEGRTRENIHCLASIHRLAGDPDKGRSAIDTYMSERSADADLNDHLMLARYLILTGEIDDGVKAYQNAIDIDSSRSHDITYELADTLFNNGFIRQAITLYEKLHLADPEDDGLSLRLGQSLVMVGSYDQAMEIAQNTEPGNPRTQVLKAIIHYKQDNDKEALSLLDAAIRQNETLAIAYYHRGVVLMKDPLQQETAIENLKKALNIDPQLYAAREKLVEVFSERDNYGEAIHELQTWLKWDPENLEARTQLLAFYKKDRNVTSALALANESIEMFPDNPAWLEERGIIYAHMGKFDNAEADYLKAVKLNPKESNLNQLANHYLGMKQPRTAIETLVNHADLLNKSPILQATRARAASAMGEHEVAENLYRKALDRANSLEEIATITYQITSTYNRDTAIKLLSESNNQIQPLWARLQIAQIEIQQQENAKALYHLQEIEKTVSPGDTDMLVTVNQALALAYHLERDYYQAEKIYRKLLELDPDDTKTMNNLAYLLADELNEPDKALQLAQQAVELSPNNANYLDTLGWIQKLNGQLEAAKSSLERSIAISKQPAGYLHLGEVYIEMEFLDRAAEYLKQAAELADKFNDKQVLEEAENLLADIRQ